MLVSPVEELGFINLEKVGGTWSWIGTQFAGGPCPLMFDVPEGLNAVRWRLDPASPTPGSDDTTVAVLIHERECVSGMEIGDRLIFTDMAHYTMVKTTTFNGIKHPAIATWEPATKEPAISVAQAALIGDSSRNRRSNRLLFNNLERR